MSFRHGIARNIGAALGLFAMLVVTLLAPVHQAHAANRDLARANGELLAASAICHGDSVPQADASTETDGDTGTIKCPICSLAKQVGAMPMPAFVAIPAVWGTHHAQIVSAIAHPISKPERATQPRAPPVLV